MKIQQFMTEHPIVVGPDTHLHDVAAILAEHGISGLPVIGERLQVLGVVSEADILVKEQGTAPRNALVRRLFARTPGQRKATARTAGEAMTSPAITIGPDSDAANAARLMTENRISRLPVVRRDGTLVGIVTRADLVRAFARPDQEIEREIREDVMHRLLWLEGATVDVRVERGEVRLSGRLPRRSDSELLERFVARVPGVVTLHSTLRWAWDDARVSNDGDISATPPTTPTMP